MTKSILAAERLPTELGIDTNQANCRRYDPDIWFPEGTDILGIRRAQTICRACPIQLDCAKQAIDAQIPEGIWGGLTPDDRKQMRNRP